MKLKPCVGCKFLQVTFWGAMCNQRRQSLGLATRKIGLTGLECYVDPEFPKKPSLWSAEDMRAEGGFCGPDRKLYQPQLRRRLFPWFYEDE